MKKGSYPTDPEMGVDIGKYEYEFIDEILDDLEELITSQVRKYLPDIPFESVTVKKEESVNGQAILLVILEFMYDGENSTAVIASEKRKNTIDIEAVW